MGRRTRTVAAPKQSSAIAAFSNPAVQQKVDDLSILFLDEAKKVMKNKIKKGDFKKLTLPDMMKEIRGMLRAIARPATTMQQINIPQAPQLPAPAAGKPVRVIEANHESDPDKIAKLRKAQQQFLEKKDGQTED